MSTRLERLITIDAQVRQCRYPKIADFCATFEVSERTIYADLTFLRERLHAPLMYDRSRAGYCYRDSNWSLPAVMLTEGELLAFFLSIELTRRYLGTAFEEPLRKAVQSLASGLPDELQIDLGDLARHYTFQAGAVATADPLLLTELFRCVREQRSLDVRYFTASTGERKRRVIDPYHLFNVRGDWQVVAHDHLRGAVRQFAVSRIEQWELLPGQRFVRDPDFSPEIYLSTGFLAERGDSAVEVVIWFDAYQSRYMRGKQWHPSQELEEHDDGALTLRFQSGALDEIRRWVMSFGRHARVLAPASLVEAIADELRTTLNWYQ